MCEKLKDYPRILDLLEDEEVGYHSTAHSTHPTIFEYTDIADYQKALHISLDRERARINPLTGELEGKGGILSLREVFRKNKIVSFRAPGFCWSPPHLEALEKLGIRFDFSANLSPIPTRHRGITFYPFSEAGYGLSLIARSIFRSILTFPHLAFRTRSRYSVVMIHPDSFVNEIFWDSIYYRGNPKQFLKVPPRSERTTDYLLRDFELFLRRTSDLVKKKGLEVTPALEENESEEHFTEKDVKRSYLRSVVWPRRYFNYRPKFLFRHFLRYLSTEPELMNPQIREL